jgi:uncharacterized protein YjbI with pentapeptide repeats
MSTLTENERFERLTSAPPKGDFEACSFHHCDLSGSDLSGYRFSDCEFADCDLSLCKLANTAFREVTFNRCKLMGLFFDRCNGIGLSFRFETCILDHSSFYRIKIPKTVFLDCRMHEADLTECDLTGASFTGCDLFNAKFSGTILEKADLRGAMNYSINPAGNRIRKAAFSIQGIRGLLDQYDISITE